MKYKKLIIATIFFFVAVNTSYFWEGKLGPFAILIFAILVIIYIGLAIVFLQQFFSAIKEKSADRHRLLTLGLVAVVLCSTFFYPFGLIDFDRLSGNDLLVAQREGGGDCRTTFKLKDNNTFIEKRICFGVTEIKGNYKILHDTIYFENVELGRYEDGFYKFALIRPSRFNQDQKHFDLVRFKDFSDTSGHELWIVKNDLDKSADNARGANISFVQ